MSVQSWRERWQHWRDRRTLERRPIPDDLWQSTLAHYPFLARRSSNDVARLRELATLFLADKEFTGTFGLEVDDAMAVAIAAQACLPVLRLGLGGYDGFKGIVVHADAVVAPRAVTDEDGVVHEYDETLSGEAMQGGPVMLSWRDVADAGSSADWGYNVVIHEFAHVLDVQSAHVGLSGHEASATWLQALEREYGVFVERVDSGEDTVLDPYGAEAIDEFFAVASEVFFVAPDDLMHEHPDVYALLAEFYRQDPLADRAAP